MSLPRHCDLNARVDSVKFRMPASVFFFIQFFKQFNSFAYWFMTLYFVFDPIEFGRIYSSQKIIEKLRITDEYSVFLSFFYTIQLLRAGS